MDKPYTWYQSPVSILKPGLDHPQYDFVFMPIWVVTMRRFSLLFYLLFYFYATPEIWFYNILVNH
jgi:hypothetical protein